MWICEKCIHCEICDEWSKEFLHHTLLYPVKNENDCDHYKSKKEYNIEIVKEFVDKLMLTAQWLPLTAIPDRFVIVKNIKDLIREMENKTE